MASSPALTCCIAWLPVRAPREFTNGFLCRYCQSLFAVRVAMECSIRTEPRSRTTSSAEYGRVIFRQRGFSRQSRLMDAAASLPENSFITLISTVELEQKNHRDSIGIKEAETSPQKIHKVKFTT